MRIWKSGGIVILLVTIISLENSNLNLAYAASSNITNSTNASLPVVNGCPIFPANNIWNTPITNLPVDPQSAAYINSIGATTGLHPDFGSGDYEGETIGIPFTTVPAGQTKVKVSFEYDDESEPGPYPIPPNAPTEGGPNGSGDRHVIVMQEGTCKLYEMFDAEKQPDNSWKAGSGAVYDLNSNALRPADWTSADAAGMPILPGLIRYEEVKAGVINHALRFTVKTSRNTYVWPARHKASSSTGSNLPPMGQRFRLKANFDISKFTPDVKVILTALKTYGMFMADNGSNWYISGVTDERWDNDMLGLLKDVPGSAFEAIDESSLQVDPNSGQAKANGVASAPGGGTSSVPGAVSSSTIYSAICQAFKKINFNICSV